MIYLINYLVAYNETLWEIGDLTGFISSIYTPSFGQYFGGLILLTIFALMYIRTGEILYPIVIWILVGASLEVMIPTDGLSIAKIFIILGIGAGLFSIFSRGRFRG